MKISKKKFITELEVGEKVDDVFLVRKIISGEKPSLLVCDRSGEMRVVFREDYDRSALDFIKPGDVIILKDGLISEHNGEKLILLESPRSMERVEKEEVKLEDLVPSLDKETIERLKKDLMNYVKGIKNDHLRILLEEAFLDKDLVERLAKTPSSMDHHHNYVGGNLEHTLSVARICDFISKIYKDLDRDLLIAGALLHDIGKSLEYEPNMVQEKTKEGILLGHIHLGERIVREKISKIRSRGVEFPEELEMLIIHMILSHHGKREWGSPEIPKTLEALVLHYADLLDAHIKYHVQKVEEGVKLGEREWIPIWDHDLKKKKRFYIGEGGR